MNLDDIPVGSLCVVDTNVLLYAEHGPSSQAQHFVGRCSSGEVKATLPQTVWQEITHKLMLAEAMMRGLTSGGQSGGASCFTSRGHPQPSTVQGKGEGAARCLLPHRPAAVKRRAP